MIDLADAAHVAEIVTACGVFVAIYQLHADRARSRKEFAARLIWEWTQLIERNTRAAAKLVNGLTSQQCDKIFNQQRLELAADEANLFLAAIAGSELKISREGDVVKLEESHSSYLRSKVTNYLNLLESVFVAWNYDVGERGILAQQFHFMVFPFASDTVFLENYLTVAEWKENYPMIFRYVKSKRSSVG